MKLTWVDENVDGSQFFEDGHGSQLVIPRQEWLDRGQPDEIDVELTATPTEPVAPQRPQAAVIEIIERGNYASQLDGLPIKPNEVRINGIPLMVPNDHPIVIEKIDVGEVGGVIATIRLFAHRVTIAAEEADLG